MSLLSLATGGVSDILGGLGQESEDEELRKAQNAALGDINTQYGKAADTFQPIYDTAEGNYERLSDEQKNGDFSIGKQTPFSLSTSQFQEDPGYQFALSQGEDAIKNGASAGGMLRSPQTAKALDAYATGQADQEYGQVYNRLKDASDTAFNQNFEGDNANFEQGMNLASPMLSAAGSLANIDTGLGQQQSQIEQNKGQINAQIAGIPYGVGQTFSSQLGQELPGMFGGGGGSPGSSNGYGMFGEMDGIGLDPETISQLGLAVA